MTAFSLANQLMKQQVLALLGLQDIHRFLGINLSYKENLAVWVVSSGSMVTMSIFVLLSIAIDYRDHIHTMLMFIVFFGKYIHPGNLTCPLKIDGWKM